MRKHFLSINFLSVTGMVILAMASSDSPLCAEAHNDAADDTTDVVPWTQLAPVEEQRAKVELGPGYIIGGAQLEAGMYLLIHRKTADDEGTYFYRLPYHPGQESSAKARCTPTEGAPVERFTVRVSSQSDGTFGVLSIQFPGSREIHSFERAEVYLGHAYTIAGVRLEKGRYLVVHGSDRDPDGEPCFFYELPYHGGQPPAAKTQCIPSQGEVAREFTIKAIAQPDGSSLVRSIQFIGSREVYTLASEESAR